MGVNEMLRRAVGGCFTDVDFAGVGARGGRGGASAKRLADDPA